MTEATKSTEVTPAASKDIAPLPEGAHNKEIVAKVNELVARANSKRDRGPDSTRVMTEDDARSVILGDLKDFSHTKAAEALGLSYGQVYSCRKGFTFKAVYQEGERAKRKTA